MQVACKRGDWPLALTTGQELLAKTREWGFVQMECNALLALGAACLGQGKLSAARQYLDQAESTAREAGDQWRLAQALVQAAQLQLTQHELGRARALLLQSLGIARELGYRAEIAQALEVLGCVMVGERDLERAWRIWTGAERLLEQLGACFCPADVAFTKPFRQVALATLGGARMEGAEAAGRSMSLDQLLAQALADATDSPTPPGSQSGIANRGRSRHRLTTREREVVVLLAEGLSNREIADRLVISESTAQVHVKRILSKLGLSSRSRVAAWAHQDAIAVPNSGYVG
jgi:non-specific serine/threonine protein kinase